MIVKTINLGNYDKSLLILKEIKNKNYGNVDIKLENLYLKKLNKLLNRKIFLKNDAYISAETLWSIMQNKSGGDKHHYHGLTEKDVLSGLKSVTEPHLVIQANKNRYLIISLFISSFGLPLMIVFELNSSLISDKNTLVNKVVTMYPKDNIEKLILKTPKNMLLYKK